MYNLIFSSISTSLSSEQVQSFWYLLKGAKDFFSDQSYTSLIYNFITLVITFFTLLIIFILLFRQKQVILRL